MRLRNAGSRGNSWRSTRQKPPREAPPSHDEGAARGSSKGFVLLWLFSCYIQSGLQLLFNVQVRVWRFCSRMPFGRADTDADTHVRIHTHTHTQTHTQTQKHTHKHTHRHTPAHPDTHAHKNTPTDTLVHAHPHTDTHTHKHIGHVGVTQRPPPTFHSEWNVLVVFLKDWHRIKMV